jgi:hypothetical protein
MLAHAAPCKVGTAPPNKPLKLTRPGFGPAAEPPATSTNVDGVTPSASSRAADRGANVANGAPLCRSHVGLGRAAYRHDR